MSALGRSLFVPLAFLAVAACDSGTEPLPPTSIEVISGNAQTGTVATALAVAPSVRVLTTGGKPAAKAAVTFTVTDGGSVQRTSALTDSKGTASPGIWTLGTKAGQQGLTATVSGLPPVTIPASASAGPARVLAAAITTMQSGTAGLPLPVSPLVRVADAYDNPVANHAVTFVITGGDGSVANASTVTAADGTASAGAWTLGRSAGVNTLMASASNVTGAVIFTAQGNAGMPARLALATAPSASAASGEPLSTQPVVQVVDQFNNKVAQAGVAVTVLAGSARVSGATAMTDNSGAAAFSALAIAGTAGVYTVVFSATGLSAATAVTTLSAGAPARLALVNASPPAVVSGSPMAQHVIEIRDREDNRVQSSAATVTASLQGPGALTGTLSVAASAGRASFVNLTYTGSGPFRISFASGALESVTTAEITASATAPTCTGPRALNLNYTLGQTARFRLDNALAPNCIQFDRTTNAGQQYLLLVENMPVTGTYETGVFPGTQPASSFMNVTVSTGSLAGSAAPRVVGAEEKLPPGMRHAWDFGDGPIYEFEPERPAGGVPDPVLIRGGDRIGINSAAAQPAPGDTVIVFLAGIPRLGIATGSQRAVIRLVTDELIIAEDIRLSTLRRSNGSLNSPIPDTQLQEIARLYAMHPKQQADLLFNRRHNQVTEQEQNRYIAVHTLMPSDGVWGYTYSTNNVFAWDYWVSSNGSAPGLAQHALKNAHNLFMHEIAHMRHWGALERARRTDQRGNRWLVEGFARFTERLPIGSYLLNNPDPSRTGNVVLPRYSEFNNSYYRDDVPTYLSAISTMFNGYEASSYVFDYFADQVAARGGNWREALANLLVSGGVESNLDNAVAAALPGLTFLELFSRARVALYTDDLDSPGLPAWTQYLQYQLRASRPPASASGLDPRTMWPRIVPGAAFNDPRQISIGSAWGYLIDGTMATSSAMIGFTAESAPYGVLTVTRIR